MDCFLVNSQYFGNLPWIQHLDIIVHNLILPMVPFAYIFRPVMQGIFQE
jgi:hypothetical protein